ncbi:hypothetical protein THRCLA_04291, partial [Thraustotheca clavata]
MDAKSKYRERYISLQQSYEARLLSLGSAFEAALRELHADESLTVLQQNDISRDFVGLRLHELVTHSLADEKEHFIKTLSEKLAKKDAHLKECLVEKSMVDNQKKALLEDMQKVIEQIEALQRRFSSLKSEKDALEFNVRQLREENSLLSDQIVTKDNEAKAWAAEKQSFLAMQQEYVRMQAMYTKDQSFYGQNESKLTETITTLTSKLQASESEKAKLMQQCNEISLQLQEQQLKSTHAKETITNLTPRLQTTQEEVNRLTNALQRAQDDAVMWRQKYEAVGEQIDLLIQEQLHEKELLTMTHDKELSRISSELHQARSNAEADSIRWKKDKETLQQQVNEREDAFRNALVNVQKYEQQLKDFEISKTELKVALTKRISQLEQEIAAISKENQAAIAAERTAKDAIQEQFMSYKRSADVKLASLQASLQHQKDSSKREHEAEKRIKWQEDAMKKHEAMLDTLKQKYEASIASLHDELSASKARASAELKRIEHNIRQEAAQLVQQENVKQESVQLERMRKEVARLATVASTAQSKVAEAAKTVPGGYISLSEHKAEIEKMTAQLTLKFESNSLQVKENWEEKKRNEFAGTIAEIQKELEQVKNELTEERKLRIENENALVLERKQTVQSRVALEEETQAKTLLIQRLEEATVNLGRLRQLVLDHQATQKDMEVDLRDQKKEFTDKEASLQTTINSLIADAKTLEDINKQIQDDYTLATATIDSLKREIAVLKSTHNESNIATQNLLKERAETIELLQKNLLHAEERGKSTLELVNEENGANIERLQAQLVISMTKHDAIAHELRDAYKQLGASKEQFVLLTNKLESTLAELTDAKAKAIRNKTKNDELRRAVKSLEIALGNTQQNQQEIQHQMTLLHSGKDKRRIKLAENVKLQGHTIRLEFTAMKRSVVNDLHEVQRYVVDILSKLIQGIETFMTQQALQYKQKLNDQLGKMNLKYDVDRRQIEATNATQLETQLKAQRKELEASFSVRIEQEKANYEQVVKLLGERDVKIETLHQQLRTETGQLQTILYQLEQQSKDGKKEIDLIHDQVVEKAKLIEEKESKIQTLQVTVSSLKKEVNIAVQKLGLSWDTIVKLVQKILPKGAFELSLDDVVRFDSVKIKQTVELLYERILGTIESDRLKAIENAIKPYKDELEKAPLVLQRSLSASRNEPSSVLAMAAPLAQELSSAKERIQSLNRDCSVLREKYDTLKVKYGQVRSILEKLATERDDAKAYAESLHRDRKALEHSMTMQLEEASTQHE